MYRTKTKRQARAAEARTEGPHAAARHTSAHARPGAHAAPAGGGRRIQVRRSGVHGKGVFALRPIAAGERIIEYVGEVLSWAAAQKRHPHDPSDPNHTFFFHVDDKRVIDAAVGGNAARWINHACEPNCQAEEEDGRIFIDALRAIAPGEELFYDYGLIVDERCTPALKKQYECRCGSARCRRTMLGKKR
ncbi:MAG: SET domain-containing protein-lysine N-methyltransferase [Rubrivivax sp.]